MKSIYLFKLKIYIILSNAIFHWLICFLIFYIYSLYPHQSILFILNIHPLIILEISFILTILLITFFTWLFELLQLYNQFSHGLFYFLILYIVYTLLIFFNVVFTLIVFLLLKCAICQQVHDFTFIWFLFMNCLQ